MTIHFSCPEGHPVSCRDDRAGKPAKCPKCGTRFVVPDVGEETSSPPGVQAERLSDSSAAIEGSDSSGSFSAPAEPSSGGPPPEEIVFLCPNGHKLNGPATLQGQPGQCPHCGSKFRIPRLEETEAGGAEQADGADGDIPMGTLVEDGDDAPPAGEIEEITEIVAVNDIEEGAQAAYDDAPPIVPMPLPADGAHPLAQIFSRLWAQTAEDSVVELFMSEGELLSPEYFAANLSQNKYGVFAVRADDGSYTLTTVPWDSVTRIAMRKVRHLPPGTFQ